MSMLGIAVLMMTVAGAPPGAVVDPETPAVPEGEDEPFVVPVAAGPIAGCVLGALPPGAAAAGGVALIASHEGSSCSNEVVGGLLLIVGAALCAPVSTVACATGGGVVESLLRGRPWWLPLIGGGVGAVLSLIGPALLFGGGLLGIQLAAGTVLGGEVGAVATLIIAGALLTVPAIVTVVTTIATSAARLGEPPVEESPQALVRRHGVSMAMAY